MLEGRKNIMDTVTEPPSKRLYGSCDKKILLKQSFSLHDNSEKYFKEVISLTNEELIQQYLSGDDFVLDEIYNQNIGFIKNIAVTVSKSYNCYRQENNHLTDYAQLILEELVSEGTVTFFETLRKNQYDESKGKLHISILSSGAT